MNNNQRFEASIDILNLLNPREIESHLNDICTLIKNDNKNSDREELVFELLTSVDVPSKVLICTETGREFLCSNFNQNANTYRSPWCNKYISENGAIIEDDDAIYPSVPLRKLELKANDCFDTYRSLYYEGGISSVYFWEINEEECDITKDSFSGVVTFQNNTKDGSGSWNSIHKFEAGVESQDKLYYKLTTSVIIYLQDLHVSSLSLSGSLVRHMDFSFQIANDGISIEAKHLKNLGVLIEKSEYNIRNMLQEVYFDKLKNIIVKDLRSIENVKEEDVKKLKTIDMIKGIQKL